ncbi:bacteriocin immunity protein [Companilactobacillus sp.]|uniref:bacteriocin immunity protein n=1 Tax=Companilactobacillus sp. TaxID=2767905 RepID=UPI0025C43D14|nr:bacteriocin immunity protein [Companilactobacillus sp.]MCH4009634.1 bacteriocin immunity protein [Companilactobacillus sp.]MCH4052690.1 bacteriocin immunity protein [Companilactobacillus sp.]MCH4077576.1 bacteriocin immunity protein [Companilactobacillus sp.]MCH4126152.1 bacteriocin immunity protein [Companilactobacillus sp.]MCI1311860.1 bacteriocin immunity protein [Companilactobacillus sp.]
MSTDEQVTTMLNQLSTAYSDPEVKQNPTLANGIMHGAKVLEDKRDTELTASIVCKNITLAYTGNKNTFPKAAITLFDQLKNTASDYTAANSYHSIMPNWFE